jgi:chaperonin GroEL
VTVRNGAAARAAVVRGVERIAALLRPTLGPLGGSVLIAGPSRPEPLERGGLIARRTIALADPFESMGAMLARQLVWRLHEETGDGTATAAVIAARLLRELTKAVEAGWNPHELHEALDRALPPMTAALRSIARLVDDRETIARLLAGSLPNPGLVAEPLDALGPEATIQVLDSHGAESSCTYRDGATWKGRLASRFFLRDEETIARLVDARVFVTDHPIETVAQLVPVLEAALRKPERSLLLVAPKWSDAAIGLLLANRDRGLFTGVLAVTPPGNSGQQSEILEDIATIAGARCLARGRADQIECVTPDDLGFARQAWATPSGFGMQGAGGAIKPRRQRLRQVQRELARTSADREWLRTRAGNLAGVLAEVRIGAASPSGRELRKQQVEAALATGRAVLRDGGVPGGGSALLMLPIPSGTSDSERIVHHALRTAFAEPLRAIAANAGLDPAPILAGTGPDRVFDVQAECWVDPWDAGLLDPAGVLISALELIFSTIGAALTIDVLVHPRVPPLAAKP